VRGVRAIAQAPDDTDLRKRKEGKKTPQVGAFGAAVARLETMGVCDALRRYLADPSRPFLGICLGLQLLFEGSDENPAARGLGVFRGRVGRFDDARASVPHMGWNTCAARAEGQVVLGDDDSERFYFVHSYRVALDASDDAHRYCVGAGSYAGDPFVAAMQRGAQCAVQFHPEKSAAAGLALVGRFLDRSFGRREHGPPPVTPSPLLMTGDTAATKHGGLARRVVCALDVRENDAGDLVVTKGDSYDVREKEDVAPSSGGDTTNTNGSHPGKRRVRNLGRPVELAARYYEEGADEIAILNICAFKGEPVADLPLLDVLRRASERVFVPLTIGGGVRSYARVDGTAVDAVDVAAAYFRAGADKVSIGSDAVRAARAYYARNETPDGTSSLERIADIYGAQAVVVSVDPRRAWLAADDEATEKHVVDPHPTARGPNGETRCWYRCTVRGGREATDLCAVRLCVAAQALGAGTARTPPLL